MRLIVFWLFGWICLFLATACGASPVPGLPTPTTSVSQVVLQELPLLTPATNSTPIPPVVETDIAAETPYYPPVILPTPTGATAYPFSYQVRIPTQSPTMGIPSTTPTPTVIRPTPTLGPVSAALRILFPSDGTIWLWQSGLSRPLVESDLPDNSGGFSEDGELVVFGRSSGMWVVNADGTGERLLMNDEEYFASLSSYEAGVRIYQLEWLPGTHLLAFTAYWPQDYGLRLADDFHLLDVDTGQVVYRLPPGEGGKFTPSPGGRYLALVTPDRLRILDRWEGKFVTSLEYPAIPAGEVFLYPQPEWSKDGASLLISIPSDPYISPPLPQSIWRLSVDGAPPVKLGEVPGKMSVEFSPDHTKLAVFLRPSNIFRDEPELIIYQLDTFAAETLYLPGWFSGWQPDSQDVVIRDLTEKPCGGLFIYRVDQTVCLAEKADELGEVNWLDERHYLYVLYYFTDYRVGVAELRLGVLDEPSILLLQLPVEDFLQYDFIYLPEDQ